MESLSGKRAKTVIQDFSAVWAYTPTAAGGATLATLLIKCFRMPKAKIFEIIPRTDMSRKRRTESSFAYLNRSAQRGSAESRELMEIWLSRVPASEHANFRARFRSSNEQLFTTALQEITLHELLRCQRCKLRFHPSAPGTAKQPDFNVRSPKGSEFILEACTSTDIASGPDGATRADRIREFLQGLDLQGYLIGIDELIEGSNDLSQRFVARHIDAGIKAAAAGYIDESIAIPPLPVTSTRALQFRRS
jgi:hypothetical protein